ncbi:MAG: helix-turn-helix domain-containing protein [Thermodesulfovibrionales bacterium]|nr:helix-turn-helix domain-containing protein [Thermodesulfovibrionales bacterium]
MKGAKPIRPIEVLASSKWLTLAEALEYARIRSRNTILKLVRSGKIYGTKPAGKGEYIFDRESIDRYYSAERDETRIYFDKLKNKWI